MHKLDWFDLMSEYIHFKVKNTVFMLITSFFLLTIFCQTREEWQGVFLIASLVHYGGVIFYGVYSQFCVSSSS